MVSMATAAKAAEKRRRRGRGARLGRADRSPLGRWFWEIDRVLLILVTLLISIGLIAVAAASPAAVSRRSIISTASSSGWRSRCR
jgi:cell division protein FtsW